VKADKVILMGGAAVALAFSVEGAQAQTAGQSIAAAPITTNFARDRNVAVRSRPRAEYEALGGRLGAFMLYPRLMGSVEYDDNIYAQDVSKESDVIYKLQPELTLSSNWSRHSVGLYARSTLSRYNDNSSEDSDEWMAGASGRLDIRRDANLQVSYDAARQTESRTSTSNQANSVVPIQYESDRISGTLTKEFNRLRLTGRASFDEMDYIDGRSITGARVEQDDRDRKQTEGMVRAEYAYSPDTAFFVQVTVNKRRYDTPIPFLNVDRDSKGLEVLGGANFELSALIRGDIGVGYMKQKFEDPIFEDISGLGVRGQLEWFPTQLTTVTLTAQRQVQDAGIETAAGFIQTSVAGQVDHELRRNIILTGQLSYGKDNYKDFPLDEKHFRAGISGTYLMNRNIGLTVGYSYYNRESSGLAASGDYSINRIGATLTLQY
jgi:hypothetical protein